MYLRDAVSSNLQVSSRKPRFQSLPPILCCILTGAIVLCGVYLGFYLIPVCTDHPSHAFRKTPILGMLAWDGEWYARIIERGYWFKEGNQSSVAFFPHYPLLAGALTAIGIPSTWSLLIVSNAALFSSFVLLAMLLQKRDQESIAKEEGSVPLLRESREIGESMGDSHGRYSLGIPCGLNQRDEFAAYSLLALGLFPATFYFRMAYSESLFLALAIAAFVAMRRGSSASLVAVICGAATGTRAVGVALLLPLYLYLWTSSANWKKFLLGSIVLTPVACWGLLNFMAYQWVEFGTPFAFNHTQTAWNSRPWPSSFGRLVFDLISLEPLLIVFDPTHSSYWKRDPPGSFPLFNLTFVNPIFFAGSAMLVLVGAWKRWLKLDELAFAAGVLLIPYLSHSYPKCGASLARYTIVCFPIYIVMGKLLAAVGTVSASLILSLAACLLCIYSALFSSWYLFY